MNRIFIFVLTVVCLLSSGCQTKAETKETKAVRSFLAGYELSAGEDNSSRVLMNLFEDGTAEFYVGTLENGEHHMEQYSGTYSLGENEEYDETISFSYTYGEEQTAFVENAVVLDDSFAAPFYFFGAVTEQEIKFYETSPASVDGDVYVGYLTKVSGMGAMTYAYSLCLKEDNTFDVSIMQQASVMHVWGASGGTYTVDGETITFTYDILTSEGEVVAKDQRRDGSDYSEYTLTAAFNIEQASMQASDAPFIRVK